ncbi:hypothetical protein [Glycomyces buryatensis]|uniref:Uncharacterized protein n=1 Tax=Glycomyces buryatensis TaxID=2570927 RepID=A0A4S8Q378_9ACTN|nr:hypothetical protein [Glycomyces buryatensis]THV38623.1 hypothetical protein FAB82_19530 [Glycomyces buryatensis]
MNAVIGDLLPYATYFLAAIPLALVTKHLFAYLSDRNRSRARLELLTRSIEGTDPDSRADILRALGDGEPDGREEIRRPPPSN